MSNQKLNGNTLNLIDGNIIIVSNRLPINIIKQKEKIGYSNTVGGLATGLLPLMNCQKCLWIGWPGITIDKYENQNDEIEISQKLIRDHYIPVKLSKKDIDDYYFGFSNKTLWPLFHCFPAYVTYDQNYFDSYNYVNQVFCDKILEHAKPNDFIWIQDFHLFLLPQMIRNHMQNANIGFFLHIPFPTYEIFRLLYWRKELLLGLLGSDLLGFHTYDYVQHFLDSIRHILGINNFLGQLTYEQRVVKVDAFPMGIDYSKYSKAKDNIYVKREISKYSDLGEKYKIILSVDRLDYTKGILNRLYAYELFLKKYPKYKEKVILILVAVPSRTEVEKYQTLKRQVDELIGKINGEYGTIGWSPIWYYYRAQPFNKLTALYSMADVALVTPLRDGMNLIAKEYISTKHNSKGVLILSEMAGAIHELNEAIVVNPNNIEEMANALDIALNIPEEEQLENNRIMQQRLSRYDIFKWVKDFITNLYQVKDIQNIQLSKKLTKSKKDEILIKYNEANKKLFLLDYDGTLISFFGTPKLAIADQELLDILLKLSENPNNEVVIISGRASDYLQNWFGDLNISLVAEHGALYKPRNGDWIKSGNISINWKPDIRTILEQYVDRTPGSFIEEKEYSLVWHYRKVDLTLAETRSKELKNALINLTVNSSIEVQEGNRNIEVKDMNVNKGKIVSQWLEQDGWDFIISIGDDATDENMFKVLPEHATSIKVGLGKSLAEYRLENPKEVRKLLKMFIGE